MTSARAAGILLALLILAFVFHIEPVGFAAALNFNNVHMAPGFILMHGYLGSEFDRACMDN